MIKSNRLKSTMLVGRFAVALDKRFPLIDIGRNDRADTPAWSNPLFTCVGTLIHWLYVVYDHLGVINLFNSCLCYVDVLLFLDRVRLSSRSRSGNPRRCHLHPLVSATELLRASARWHGSLITCTRTRHQAPRRDSQVSTRRQPYIYIYIYITHIHIYIYI